jgi:WD40 repeat protein
VAEPITGHTDWVTSVAFSPDGALIMSGSLDNTIRMWDARNQGVALGVLEGHTGTVTSIAFSPDGARLVSSSHDRAIRIWDVHPMSSDGSDASDDWVLRDDGWVVAPDGRLLLWVPGDLRTGLMFPRNTAVICRDGSLRLNFNGTASGERWGACYIES